LPAARPEYDPRVTAGVILPVVAVLLVLVVAFLAALVLPPRWIAAVGAVFAVGEWILAYQRSVDRDDAREGVSLVLFTGLFAFALLLLWLAGVAGAVAVRRRRGRRESTAGAL
jgi:hypothetical protein